MPNYQYSCLRHGQFEKTFVPMKDSGLKQACPTCGDMCSREYVSVAVVSDTAHFTSERLGKIDGGRDNSLIGEHYMAMARRAGVNPNNKQYISQLADYAGDPEAWVDSRGDMVRVAKKKGLNIDEGIAKYKHESKGPPDLQGGIAADLAVKLAKKIMRENPGMKPQRALEEAVNRHAPKGQKRIIKTKRKAAPKAPNIKRVNR